MENARKVYLDNAATTPLRNEVKERMMELLEGPHGNPSSTHQFGRKSKGILEAARKYVSQALNCQGGEVVFTSGGTEADNMAMICAVRDLGVKRIITSALEHHAVLHTAEALEKDQNVKVEMVALHANGAIDMTDLENKLKEGTPTLVSLMHGNNEVGNLLDLKATGELCKQYGAYFHSDTVQTLGHYPIDLGELHIDFLTASAHKFYGPKGVGFLYVNSRNKVRPFVEGGSQERNMRGGTENIMGIGGLHSALKLSIEGMEEENDRILGLKKYLISRLKENVSDIQFNGRTEDYDNSLVSVVSVRIPSLPNDNMHLFALDMRGIAASGGSACSSGSNKGSHVIQALYPDNDAPVVRFSIGKDNTQEEMDYVVEAIVEMTNQAVAAS